MKGWANVKNAAKYADVSERTLRNWLKDGLIHSRLNAKTIRVRYSDVDDFLCKYQVNDNQVDDLVNEILKEL